MAIGTERVGQRIYITGDSFALKDRLKAAGCHWDGGRRQWWIGAAKGAAIEGLIAEAATAPPPAEDLDRARVQCKVEYEGRTYYCIASDGRRGRLVTLDGKLDFWADRDRCRVLKDYHPREYRGRTEYTTLGSIRRFAAEMEGARRSGAPLCAACGRPGPLIEDLEDGMMKHPGCCDIPSS